VAGKVAGTTKTGGTKGQQLLPLFLPEYREERERKWRMGM